MVPITRPAAGTQTQFFALILAIKRSDILYNIFLIRRSSDITGCVFVRELSRLEAGPREIDCVTQLVLNYAHTYAYFDYEGDLFRKTGTLASIVVCFLAEKIRR